MEDTRYCPHCHTDLRGEPIPADYLVRRDYGGATHFYRTIGVNIRGVYDGALYWQCPDCGGKWHRFPEGNPYRQRAEEYVNR